MGAWGHRAYDNDTGQEWLDGLAESLKFMLLRQIDALRHAEKLPA